MFGFPQIAISVFSSLVIYPSYYLEKIDINEEIIRLKKHIELFTKTINQKSPKGKKLNFVCQEIGREDNTCLLYTSDAADE